MRQRDEPFGIEARLGHRPSVALDATAGARIEPCGDGADLSVAEAGQITSGRIARLALREADIDVDRIIAELHRLHHRYARALEQAPGMCGLVSRGKNHSFRMLTKKSGNGSLLFGRGIAAVKDEDLKARRQKHIVESPEIVRKHAIRQ